MTRRQALHSFLGFLAGSPLLDGQFAPREEHRRVPSLEELASVFEFEPVARAKITQRSYDYITGGVEAEYTLRRNRKAFEWATLIPRAMADVSSIDLSTEALGQPMASPILVAPTAGHQQLHPDGEKETHRGATAAGVTMVVSNNSSYRIEEIAPAAEGPLWAQLYVRRDRGRARGTVDRSLEAGCRAICLTVDTQYGSLRERLLHDSNLTASRRRAASRRRRRRRAPEPPNPFRLRFADADLDWQFVDTLRTWTDGPLLIKGLLTAEDAELAIEHGADGIVVSNHGARYLDYAPATFEVLPEIVEAVAGRIAVLIDGGFRRGSDILKALAIGANAVQVGRPPLWGLGAFGAAGTQRVLEILQAELALAMAHTGCSRINDIDPSMVETDFP